MGPRLYQVELIGSGFLSVMAKPVSGEWIDDEFQGIASEGILRVVSLLEVAEAYEVGLSEEKEYCEKYGMEFVSFPIPDRGLPESAARFGAFTKSLYDDCAGGKNTVIHCRAGIGRTGLVAGAVLLHAALKAEEAFDQISKARGVEVPDTPEQYSWLVENHRTIVGRA